MSTAHADLFNALAAPFRVGGDRPEVKTRSQGGRQLRYVTARTIMNRLDEVVGPENWWDRYRAGGENSIVCDLTIRLPDGQELTKCDAGGCAGMADSGDDEKSGYSDAFKRAAVKFGVSRYLYNDGIAYLGEPAADRDRDRERYGVDGGELTVTRAEPVDKPRRSRPPGPAPAAAERAATLPHPAMGEVPPAGKPFFGWAKDLEQARGFKVLAYLTKWAKRQGFPGRIVDWDDDQTTAAYGEIMRKIATAETQERTEPAYATN